MVGSDAVMCLIEEEEQVAEYDLTEKVRFAGKALELCCTCSGKLGASFCCSGRLPYLDLLSRLARGRCP